MTLQQVAEYLGCRIGTIYRLVKNRQITALRRCSDQRFRRSVLEQWMRDRQVSRKMGAEHEFKSKRQGRRQSP